MVVLGLVIVASVATATLVGSRVRSPQERLADAAPPDPTTLTEPVVRTVVSETAAFTGVVAYEAVRPVTNPGGGIVTRLPLSPGAPVEPGTLLAEVEARPVFAAELSYPLYRDITPGASGDDVAALQDFLTRLGYSTGDSRGSYGRATEGALQRFYRDRGYEAPRTSVPTDDQVAAVAEEAQAAAAQFDAALDEATAASARASFERARQEYERLRASQGYVVRPAELANLATLPGKVVRVVATVGSGGQATLLEVGVGNLVVGFDVPPERIAAVEVGLTAEVDVGSATLTGTVGTLEPPPPAASEGGGAEDPSRPPGRPTSSATVVLDDPTALPMDLIGATVPLAVVLAASDGVVLAVPVSAVFEGVDGQTYLEVLGEDGRRRLPVATGVVGGGLVEVSAADPVLAEGATVVVGSGATSSAGRATGLG